jgi:hypothetical protein
VFLLRFSSVISNRYLTGNTPQTRYCNYRIHWIPPSLANELHYLISYTSCKHCKPNSPSPTKLFCCCGDFYGNRGVPGVTHHSPRAKCLSQRVWTNIGNDSAEYRYHSNVPFVLFLQVHCWWNWLSSWGRSPAYAATHTGSHSERTQRSTGSNHTKTFYVDTSQSH